eukprot:scpid92519/ scgid18002/ 
MENIDAIGSKLTAVGAIDKLRFLVDALALLREQAEAYAKRLEDVDTGIRKDIRDRLNTIDRTYLPELRVAKSKIADVQHATQEYVIALETLVSSILSTPTYRDRLKEEVRRVRESEVEDNPRSLLASYRRVLAAYLSDTDNALNAWGAATKKAQEILENLSGTSKELKHALDQARLASNDYWIMGSIGAGATAVTCVGAAVGLGLAIANVPAAAAICAGLGIAGAGLYLSAVAAVAGTVGMALLSNKLWNQPNIQEQERKSCGEALEHVREIELLTKELHGELSALDGVIQDAKADVAHTGAEKRCLERALDDKDFNPEGFVLPALKDLWGAARKHNIPGRDVTADSAE